MLDKMAVYNHLPVLLQNIACFVEGQKIVRTRYGEMFWEILSKYEGRNTWPYEKICDYRDQRLQKIVRYCYKAVPYYRNCFDEYGIDPEQIKSLEDLSKLPIITKQTINENIRDFVSKDVNPSCMISSHTSGTTGAGFVFQTTQKALCEQWAVWWRYRRRLGIQFDTWCAMFGGRSIVPIAQVKPPFYRINKPGRQIYFSAYHMTDRNMKYYVETLEKYRLHWLHGYPSSLALLAQYMVDNHIKLPYRVKWITTGAENLLQQQRDVIKKAFGVIPYQHYGMSEGVSNISEDLNHRYTIDEDYACTEFIYDSESDSYRIIGTSLTNYAMPLLRYEVGDNAQLVNGSRREIVSIDGRKEDYLVLSNGAKIGRLDHIFKDMVNIREAQIRQDKTGVITFCIVKGRKYDDTDEIHLNREIKERLGKEPYHVAYTDYIEKSKSGKLRFVVSEKEGGANAEK